jgi:hypothetical protein
MRGPEPIKSPFAMHDRPGEEKRGGQQENPGSGDRHARTGEGAEKTPESGEGGDAEVAPNRAARARASREPMRPPIQGAPNASPSWRWPGGVIRREGGLSKV